MRAQKGFTLIELMIAVALLAVLMMIAIPSYRGYTERADRADVQATLASAATAMERYKSQRFSYSGATAGNTSASIIPDRSPTSAPAGQQKYDITLTFPGGGSTFLITAVSTVRFNGNGNEVLTINQAGARCWRPLETGNPTTCDPALHKTW